MSISDSEIVVRYANNYNLPLEEIDAAKVWKHWNLEKSLAKKLIQSTKADRFRTFLAAYNTLYTELPWLLKTGSSNTESNAELFFDQRWLPLLVEVSGKTIYEIGSGNGKLIRYLAQKEAFCIGTEISNERPNKEFEKNLDWHSTDGVNLTDYEPASSFDYVISDQVVEHLHPDDIKDHLTNVYRILKSRGEYIFYTPNYFMGPGDVSLIFETQEAEGMHLKEYKYFELVHILKQVGFINIRTRRMGRNSIGHDGDFLSQQRFKVFLFLEKLLSLVPSIKLKKRLYRKARLFFGVHNEIVLLASKP